MDYRQVECPKGEALMNRGVGLQMIPNFTEDDLADMIQATRKVADAARDGGAGAVEDFTTEGTLRQAQGRLRAQRGMGSRLRGNDGVVAFRLS